MSTVELPSDAVALHAVRRLFELARRRLRSEPMVVQLDGRPVELAAGRELCAHRGAAALRERGEVAEFPCHDGQVELVVPIRVGELLVGGVTGSADPGERGLLFDLLDLAAAEIAAYLRERGLRSHDGRPTRYPYERIIGRSRPMLDLLRLLDKVVESDSTVLIQGENGTGKELVARAIHDYSTRAAGPFVVQNCSAFNDNLLDSELFGHKKGAFTGAVADKQGLFEVAHRGTFFLDEIGDMSPALQVKLLRVLQEGTFTPVGDTVTRQVDVRIIAASNRNLRQMVERGEFREDLFYRVNVIVLTLPPLRDRREDIPLLVEHVMARQGRGRRLREKKLSRGCVERLTAYGWPGNVRELENELERLWVLSGDERLIGEELLSPRLREAAIAASGSASLVDTREAVERKTVYEALRKHDWNKTRAAVELQISRRNLIRKVQKYQLDPRRQPR